MIGFNFDLDQVIVSTLPSLHNYQIERHINIVSKSQIVTEGDLNGFEHNGDSEINFEESFQELSTQLKQRAIQLGGNAVLNVNYTTNQISPTEDDHESRYRITCTGSVVWVSEIGG